MNRAVISAAALALLAASLASVAGAPSPAHAGPRTGTPPLWVRHAERYPGSLSEGVRATALLRRSPLPGARAGGPVRAAASSGNVQANAPSGLPQDETAVAFDAFHPLRAVAAW